MDRLVPIMLKIFAIILFLSNRLLFPGHMPIFFLTNDIMPIILFKNLTTCNQKTPVYVTVWKFSL